ncbi:3,4-dihydroxy 2-butanone 4-phosphate synthase / GTP cyclohydrolase II [Alteribacillus persepolensis]|uniref:3,4-dihydroxy-2-butanone-4-phosphate synthase n=1 Tax=Alteribacillus persepolensis TaxID=568899 RepID=A0A1G8GXZ5_9BACI|nr:3,4-dihydroxy-2-butanone-4-phosphate synthase [Alteribacillus persepolensis]SDH99295.1 3,4-dihydroxy 2-butanone 4-phosphate synthase / GTP cyclohydrolase II [Alteribacillus persepolensis]
MNLAVKRALQELSQGNLIVLRDAKGQGKLLGLADHTTSETVNFMIKYAKGLVSVGIEDSRAQELDLTLQEQSPFSNEEVQSYTVSVDIEETTTGISAFERYQTIAALIDSARKPEEFKRPGHIFPVIAHEKGIFGKQTHVELGIALAKQAGAYPAVVLCDVLNENGGLAGAEDMKALADEHDMFMLRAEDVMQEYTERETVVNKIDEKRVTNFVGDFTLISYENRLDSYTDFVFAAPSKDQETVPVYVHKQCSQCPTMACDCHHHFQQALSRIKTMGGICLQMRYRQEQTTFTQVLDKNETDVLAVKILKDMGIGEFHFINQNLVCNTEGESLEEKAI